MEGLQILFGAFCSWSTTIPTLGSRVSAFFSTLTALNDEMDSFMHSHETVVASLQQQIMKASQLENHFNSTFKQIQSGAINDQELGILFGDILKQKNDLASSSSSTWSTPLCDSIEISHGNVLTAIQTSTLQCTALITDVSQYESNIDQRIDIAHKLIENHLPTLRCNFQKIMSLDESDTMCDVESFDLIQLAIEEKLNEWMQLKVDMKKAEKCSEWLIWVENEVTELKKKREQMKEKVIEKKTNIIKTMMECQRQIDLKMKNVGVFFF